MKISHRIEENNFAAPLFIAISALLMSFTCADNPLVIGNTYTDSSVFHYVARVILKGGMPYRDAFDHKGPLIYLIDAFGLWINHDIGVWIVELVFIFVALLFAYKIARLVGCNKIKSMLVVALTVIAWSYYFVGCGNLAEEYSCTFIMTSLYIFLKFFKNDSVNFFELIACGISFGAVCLLKVNQAVLWVVMFFGVLIQCVKSHEIKKFLKYFLVALAGVAIIVLPIIIWLIKNDAFAFFIEDYLEFNSMYISDPQQASPRNILKAFFYFIEAAPVALSSVILIYFCLRDKRLIDYLCLVAVVFSIAMMVQSGKQYSQYAMLIVPLVTYALARFISEILFSRFSLSFKVAAAFMIVFMFANSFYFFIMGLAKSLIHYRPSPFTEAQEIARIIKANTDPDDKITVCGNDNLIYLLSERFSSSIYSYQNPVSIIDSRIKVRYINDIKKLDAKIFVCQDKKYFWFEDLDEILNENYVFLKKIGEREIYKLKHETL